MSPDWTQKTVEKIFGGEFIQSGIYLFLGAADTGKTTLIKAMAERLVGNQSVGIIDADIGQSHIGPPTTVGWAVAEKSGFDFSKLGVQGISFVGDVTPSGHLLQLTAGIVRCVERALKISKLVLIDTPGFVKGPAACALWWTVQRILQPHVIVAAQRNNELRDILAGLNSLDFQLELIEVPQDIPLKSMQERRDYRPEKFREYFHDAETFNIDLSKTAVQMSGYGDIVGRLVSLRDSGGNDLAVGVVTEWKENIAAIKAPPIDIDQVRCVVVGDVTI
jgi:polynucleotide 5'-hydroxyl-kinase GRC3/NOL9